MSSKGEKSILIGGGLAVIGGLLGGPIGAQIGWLVGSSVGSILDLEKQSPEITHGPRVTDFKVLNSKYGITIPRGYGCVRVAPNMIWAGPVIEETEETTECVNLDIPKWLIYVTEFFGGSGDPVEVCETEVIYHYYQSAAFALCEGEVAELTRIWADGKLVYSVLPDNFGIVEEPETLGDLDPNLYQGFPAFTLYLGTATQEVDPIIAADLGADAIPYRNIAYIVINEMLLDPFGYRIPTLNAEVCYESANLADSVSTLDTTTVSGTGYDVIGLVEGRPDLLLAVSNAGSSTTVAYDLITGEVLQDTTGGFSGGSPTFFVTDSSYNTIRGETTAGGYRVGVFNYQTGEARYWYEWTASGDLLSLGSGIEYVTYNAQTATFNVSTTGGALLVAPNRSYVEGSSSSGYVVADTLSNGEVTLVHPQAVGVGREVFSIGGSRYWLTDGPSGVYINEVNGSNRYTGFIVSFSDSENLTSASNWTYNPQTDAFYINVDVAGTTEPAGIYRLDRSDLNYDQAFTVIDPPPNSGGHRYGGVNLPSSGTAGEYSSIVANEISSFQSGPTGNSLYFENTGGNVVGVNLGNLSLIQTITALPAGSQTIYSPTLQTVISNGYDLIAFRALGAATSLDVVVSDLMTTSDGDPRVTLTTDDIDVTDLALDSVRGYLLIAQQSVRNAVTVLQQAYFFDVVETDGKIKFVKRGGSVVANLVEDELAAHEYGRNTSSLVPVSMDRQAESELPREIVVNYTEFLTDYQQGTQRARRHQTDAESNTSVTIPIVFTPDEAAQIADVMLAMAWSERLAPFEIQVGPRYLALEPSDIISVTMNNGAIHILRVVEIAVGANFVVQLTLQREFVSLYQSTATGVGSAITPETTINAQNTEVFLLDVPTTTVSGFTAGSGTTPGIFVGAGTTGDPNNFEPVTVRLSNGQLVTVDSPATFGFLSSGIGTPSTSSAGANQFDYDTSLVFTHQGGVIPDPCTEAEALALSQSCLVIVGDEIIAYTGLSVNGSQVTLTGLLRGLYGTDQNLTHSTGDQVVFLANLVYTPIGTEPGIITGTVDGGRDTIAYNVTSATPLAPAEPSMVESDGDYVLSWIRRDYASTAKGFRDGTSFVPNSEGAEQYTVRIRDALAEPPTTIRTLSPTTSSVTYTEEQQIEDWGAAPAVPFLVDIAQNSPNVGAGISRVAVMVPDDVYAPLSEDFANSITADVVTRWNGSEIVSNGALSLSTTVDETYGAAYPSRIGATKDVELMAIITPGGGGLTREHCGVVLRGIGPSVTGMFIGLGGTLNDELIARQMLGGTQGIVQTAAYSWAPATTYRIRARHVGSRVQAKVWEDGDYEPQAWNLDFLDNGGGPFFGFSGVFAYYTAHTPSIEHLAWSYRGLGAA